MGVVMPNKKDIVDFLWEWAEGQGDWAKIMIDKIVSTESPLKSAERSNVFNYFLQSIDLHKGLPEQTVNKPVYTPSTKRIELQELSSVQGVNRLAKDQKIGFSRNLTAVFGENGTGKTGYGRILKSLGFSYDTNNTILSNVFEEERPKSAQIDFEVGGESKTFSWNAENKDSELGNISVFNSNCVQISLSDNRELLVSPIGFHLFNLVTDELDEFSNLLKSKRRDYSTEIPWIESLNQGTPQSTFVAGLSANTSEKDLSVVSDHTVENEAELKIKESELANLNKGLLESEIQNLNSIGSELHDIIGSIENTSKVLTSEEWKTLSDLNQKIKEREGKTKLGIKEIAETNGIDFYQTREFQSFIEAAEGYIKVLYKPDYPSADDTCVYCLQPLQDSARDLLNNYRSLLNDTSQRELVELKQKKSNLVEKVSKLKDTIVFRYGAFGFDENQEPIQPAEIREFNTALQSLKLRFLNNQTEGFDFNLVYDKYLKFLNAKKSSVGSEYTKKKELLSNLASKETELKSQIAELKDRKVLFEKREAIKKIISNHKVIANLDQNSGSFNTYAISRKTSEAREELIQANFNETFQKELLALRKSHINIDLGFGTDRGTSKVYHKIGSHVLADILSEGEQKAIALAEFLTELNIGTTSAPVIFDDPVNSLDHHIIDDVAKRLLKLSEERQVVVLTHSVLLFNSFLYYSKQPSYKQVATKFYNVKNEFDYTGYITEAEEEINKVKRYMSKINGLINNTPKDQNEADIAADGYGALRSAIELFVEHEIFQGTIKRYQKNVALTNFLKIKGDELNTHKGKLNEVFERCCGYIKGHSNPIEIHNDPTMIELKSDFEEFKSIRAVFV